MPLCRLGAVTFDATTEERPQYVNEVTDRPVEELSSIVDHVNKTPFVLSIEGYVTGPNAPRAIRTLRGYADNKDILRYVGRNVFPRVVVESITSDHSGRVAGGFFFAITLKEVRVAKSEVVNIDLPVPPPVKTQAVGTSTKGKQAPSSFRVDAFAGARIAQKPSTAATRVRALLGRRPPPAGAARIPVTETRW